MRSNRLYLKDPEMSSIGAVESKQNVTIPFVYDSLDDTNFEPQFMRMRRPNTSTFYQGNIGNALINNPSVNIDLNGQNIFNGAKRLYISNVVIDEDTINDIRPGNSTLSFTYLDVYYTVNFNTASIKTAANLIAYLNNTIPNYSITPAFSGFKFVAAPVPYDDNLIIMYFEAMSTTLLVTIDFTSTLFTQGQAMWGAFQEYPGLTSTLYLNSKYIPAFYWDFKSTQLNKYNKNFNRASNNSTSTLYRYYFINSAVNKSTYSMNWNKESITSFDISVVDDNGVTITDGYDFQGSPFICFELVGEQ